MGIIQRRVQKEITGNADDAQKKIRDFADRCLKGETITLLSYDKNRINVIGLS